MENGSYPEHDDGMTDVALGLIAIAVDGDDYQATFTKIFLQFPQKFWFDTQVSIM
jgi:hypothetical protein